MRFVFISFKGEGCGLFLLRGRNGWAFYFWSGKGLVFFLRGIGFSFSFRDGGALLFVEGFRAGFFCFRGWEDEGGIFFSFSGELRGFSFRIRKVFIFPKGVEGGYFFWWARGTEGRFFYFLFFVFLEDEWVGLFLGEREGGVFFLVDLTR